MHSGALSILLFVASAAGLGVALVIVASLLGPRRSNPAKRMPYESGMDPIHPARRRFDFRFYLLAITFLVFDVELLFLYPWAAANRPALAAGDGNGVDSPVGDCPDSREAKMGLSLSAPAPSAPESGATAGLPNRAPDTVEEVPHGIDAAVSAGLVESRSMVFVGVMVFLALVVLGFIYDWRKGVFQWR